jgi:hypothetical protein
MRAMRAYSAPCAPGAPLRSPPLCLGACLGRTMRASKPSPPFAWTCLLSCARLERVLRASHIAWGRTLERFPLPRLCLGACLGRASCARLDSPPPPPCLGACQLSCARIERVLRASHNAWGRTLARCPLPPFCLGRGGGLPKDAGGALWRALPCPPLFRAPPLCLGARQRMLKAHLRASCLGGEGYCHQRA